MENDLAVTLHHAVTAIVLIERLQANEGLTASEVNRVYMRKYVRAYFNHEWNSGSNPLHASDHKGRTALHFAVKGGHLPVVEALVAEGVDLLARTAGNETVLHLAARHDHATMITYLVKCWCMGQPVKPHLIEACAWDSHVDLSASYTKDKQDPSLRPYAPFTFPPLFCAMGEKSRLCVLDRHYAGGMHRR